MEFLTFFKQKSNAKQLAYYVPRSGKNKVEAAAAIEKLREKITNQKGGITAQEFDVLSGLIISDSKETLESYLKAKENDPGYQKRLATTVHLLNREWYIQKGTTAAIVVFGFLTICYVAYRYLSAASGSASLEEGGLPSMLTDDFQQSKLPMPNLDKIPTSMPAANTSAIGTLGAQGCSSLYPYLAQVSENELITMEYLSKAGIKDVPPSIITALGDILHSIRLEDFGPPTPANISAFHTFQNNLVAYDQNHNLEQLEGALQTFMNVLNNVDVKVRNRLRL